MEGAEREIGKKEGFSMVGRAKGTENEEEEDEEDGERERDWGNSAGDLRE